MTDWQARAAELDRDDPLAALTQRFIPADGVVAYLDGNSLGRPLVATRERVAGFLDGAWGTRLIRSWDEQWMDEPLRLGDRIGALTLGAASGQTVVADSTTVMLYKLIRAAVDARPGRDEIVLDDDNFPTDRFIVEGVAAERGLSVRWIQADPDAGVTPSQVASVVSDRTALVVLSHVAYRSGFIADVPAITRIAHDAGALVLWDLCHSVGAVPVALDEWGVDLAVGCTYKYLNGGPGSPAFGYVAARLHGELAQPIWGWMGARDVFAMGPSFERAADMRQYLSGTPPIVGMLAMHDMLDLIDEAGMDAVRAKSLRLTDFAIEMISDVLVPLGVRLNVLPHERRGSHVTIAHASFREVTAALWERGVIPDFRNPDGIRIGLSPLSTTFAEVAVGIGAIREQLLRTASPT